MKIERYIDLLYGRQKNHGSKEKGIDAKEKSETAEKSSQIIEDIKINVGKEREILYSK